MSTERENPYGLRHDLRVVHGLGLRWLREVYTEPAGALVMLGVKPVLWYVLFGSLFDVISHLSLFPASDYRAYILPGIAALMSAEFLMFAGIVVVNDIDGGFLQKMWAAPINRSSVVLGGIVYTTTLNAVQVAVLLAVAHVDGLTFATGSAGVVTFYAMAVLLTAFLTATSLFLAYWVKHQMAFTVLTQYAMFPLLFVSNAFMPIDLMPDWLGTLAGANPVSIVMSGMHALLLDGWVMADVLPAVAFLVVGTVSMVAVTSRWFRRPLDRG